MVLMGAAASDWNPDSEVGGSVGIKAAVSRGTEAPAAGRPERKKSNGGCRNDG